MLVCCARHLKLWPFWIDAGFSTQLPCRSVRKLIDFFFFKFTSFMQRKKKVYNKWEGMLLSVSEMIGVLSWGTCWNVQETNSFSNNQEISYILWNSEGLLLYSQKHNTCHCFEPEEFSSHTPILFLLLHLSFFCVRCNLCWWQFLSLHMVSLLQVYPPVSSLHFSSPPCMPDALPTYILTHLYSLI